MKKALVILTLLAAGVVLQSCGGSEKCPAYTEVNSTEEARG